MAMTDAERDAEVAPFDREDIAPGKPLTKADRQRHCNARRRGRPVVGRGAMRITTCVEKGLLAETDHFARMHGLSRAQVISRGLKKLLRSA